MKELVGPDWVVATAGMCSISIRLLSSVKGLSVWVGVLQYSCNSRSEKTKNNYYTSTDHKLLKAMQVWSLYSGHICTDPCWPTQAHNILYRKERNSGTLFFLRLCWVTFKCLNTNKELQGFVSLRLTSTLGFTSFLTRIGVWRSHRVPHCCELV